MWKIFAIVKSWESFLLKHHSVVAVNLKSMTTEEMNKLSFLLSHPELWPAVYVRSPIQLCMQCSLFFSSSLSLSLICLTVFGCIVYAYSIHCILNGYIRKIRINVLYLNIRIFVMDGWCIHADLYHEIWNICRGSTRVVYIYLYGTNVKKNNIFNLFRASRVSVQSYYEQNTYFFIRGYLNGRLASGGVLRKWNRLFTVHACVLNILISLNYIQRTVHEMMTGRWKFGRNGSNSKFHTGK